jgi:hypothetical protein
VAEAGPLVFLEALASGCFPLGTYFAGMAASIDAVSEALPAEHAGLMRLSASDEETVFDIAYKTPDALIVAERFANPIRRVAVERYDWERVARKLSYHLSSLI